MKQSSYFAYGIHGAGADGTFSAQSWLQAFNKASRTRDGGALRSLRVDIVTDTIRCCEKLSYKLITGEEIQITTPEALTESVKRCQLHNMRQALASVSRQARFDETKIEVIDGDCLEAAIDMKLNRGLNPAVLNMASHRRPGGGYKHGAGAQEENLHRRSNYYQCLEDPDKIDPERKWSYPLSHYQGVYSPSVQVFRSPEAQGYEFMPKPIAIDFIAVAAYSHPELVTKTVNGKEVLRLAPKVIDSTKDKIRLILSIGLYHQHDSLVLSAFGCGAFCNPPEHMAELFRQVIDTEFAGCFKHICFAIFDDHNSRKAHNPDGNVLPFKRVFGLSTPEDEAEARAARNPAKADPTEEEEPRKHKGGAGRGERRQPRGGKGGRV